MRFTTLCSGSGGNSTWVEGPQGAVLIDAGLSATVLEDLMDQAGIDSTALKGLFITHEHGDHWRGGPLLAERLGIPIYLTEGTRQALGRKIRAGNRLEIVRDGQDILVSGMIIRPHSVEHDAAEPVCYSVVCGEQKIAVVTDLGVADDKVARIISRADVLVFEANYDPEMLRRGPYPAVLKSRISGGRGHLSNAESAHFLREHLDPETRFVLLAHLSEKNNTELCALKTMRDYLGQHLSEGLGLAVALRDRPFGILDLDGMIASKPIQFQHRLSG